MPAHPKTIQLNGSDTLAISWSDGHEGTLTLRMLRDACPCAGCKGETILFESYTPPPSPELPGKYVLSRAEQVGHYALQLFWGDGHGTGIYTWQSLRDLCQCEDCESRRSASL